MKNHNFILFFNLLLFPLFSIIAMEKQSSQLILKLEGGLFSQLSTDAQIAAKQYFSEFSLSPGEQTLPEFGKQLFDNFHTKYVNQIRVNKNEEKKNLLDILKTTRNSELPDPDLKEAYEAFFQTCLTLEEENPGSVELFKSLKQELEIAFFSNLIKGITDIDKVPKDATKAVTDYQEMILNALAKGTLGKHLNEKVQRIQEKFKQEVKEEAEKNKPEETLLSQETASGFFVGAACVGLIWFTKKCLLN